MASLTHRARSAFLRVYVAVISLTLVFRLIYASPLQTVLQTSATATTDPLNPYPNKPKLTFNAQGQFKLAVFTDLHFGELEDEEAGPAQDTASQGVMNYVLDTEAPNFVVFDGDQVSGDQAHINNATVYITEALEPIMNRSIPFSSTYGNHDNDRSLTHLISMQHELNLTNLSYTRPAPPGVGGNDTMGYGVANYWVPVFANEGDTKPALLLWFFDSRSGRTYGNASQQIDDWVDHSVPPWIESETATMEAKWGSLPPSLVFVHIPPHAFLTAQTTNPVNTTIVPGLAQDNLTQGGMQDFEAGSGQPVYQGQDQPFMNTVVGGSIGKAGIISFVSGHDHGDAWCAPTSYNSSRLILCFAKHTGHGGYTGPNWGYGSRIFSLSLESLSKKTQTWVRMEDGEVRYNVTLDDSYGHR